MPVIGTQEPSSRPARSFRSTRTAPVSPAIPLLDVQCMVTRRTPSGQLHGPNQAVSLDDALRAHTINAAYHMRREHDLGSIAVGKFADSVELSADPYTVDARTLTEHVQVVGTWSGGRKLDLDACVADIERIDPTEHEKLPKHVTGSRRC